MSKKREVNALKRKDMRRLEDWVVENMPQVRVHGWSMNEAAKQAEKDLGVSVTGNNIKGAVATMELKWPFSFYDKGKSRTELGATRIVVEEILRLEKKLGEEPGEDFEILMSVLGVEDE